MKLHILLFIFLSGLALASCGGSKESIKKPVDNLIKNMPDNKTFSIILDDMDVQGSFFKHYYHKYKIITNDSLVQTDTTKYFLPRSRTTEWYEVDENYFKRHQDNMGMEIASRGDDGKLNKNVAPPGYNNYVGNPRYGSWQQGNGFNFWQFYGQYAFMSSMFNLLTYPARRSYYNDWRRNYYGTGRSYYGPVSGSGRYYGTGSAYNKTSRPNSTWSRNTSSFKRRVENRTSRSGSRYSGSSSRSRGSGYGK